ncbi:hypothetical protein GE107_20145 [Cohnella sp. CFH 77786]|uniref:hypothetical protein n=1 Tax=Cohnella sp. CFH 77786 TaxID=2662265 RepID=UPI001C60BE9B|nr:hypothetical protein [Cohnella sp. CFH 77786]MBW5448358.1 hypothetical protein [Cohnella sp. CFH 77786]
MRSYQSHLQQTSAANAAAVARKPTFRSSAIFPVFHLKGVRTRIAFLGYWMIKRSIPEIHSVVTLRSIHGTVLCRTSERITEAKAYRVEAEDLLAEAGMNTEAEFTGSLEIEFYSSRDLVYPYPAVVVQYYGPEFGTVVHTAQRVFNDAEDRNANLESVVPEAGFNVYADEDREPFFAFVNGCDPVRGGRIAMKFYNSKRETLECLIPLSQLLPYETTVVHPDRHVDLQSFLDGKPGTAQIQFDVSWVFPRIIAGNVQRSRQGISVTHTYYDTSGSSGEEDYWKDTPEGWVPASLYVPLSVSGDRYTNINFYPIYSPSELEIDVELYEEDGTLIGTLRNVHRIAPVYRGLHTLELKPLAARLGADPNRTAGANLVARTVRGSRLPARLKIGLDYGMGGHALPCNICKTMDVANPALENKKSSFHWAPVLADQADAVVWLVNSAPIHPYVRKAEVTLTFYREQDTAALTRTVELQPNGIHALRLSELAELREFFGGRMGWYTCVSSNPHVKSYYLSESPSGIVGGDHDF